MSESTPSGHCRCPSVVTRPPIRRQRGQGSPRDMKRFRAMIIYRLSAAYVTMIVLAVIMYNWSNTTHSATLCSKRVPPRPRPSSLCRDRHDLRYDGGEDKVCLATRAKRFRVMITCPGVSPQRAYVTGLPCLVFFRARSCNGLDRLPARRTCRVLRWKGEYLPAPPPPPLAGLSPTPDLTPN